MRTEEEIREMMRKLQRAGPSTPEEAYCAAKAVGLLAWVLGE